MRARLKSSMEYLIDKQNPDVVVLEECEYSGGAHIEIDTRSPASIRKVMFINENFRHDTPSPLPSPEAFRI